MYGLNLFKFALFCVIFSVFLNANCTECHEKIEKFDAKNHDFSCQTCHLKKADILSTDHAKIIAHPASNENMSEFCGECHESHIKSYKNSNHFTHKNEINTILKAFDIDKNASILEFANLQKENLDDTQKLAIEIISQKCLNCHTSVQGQNGAFRGLGCMACHTHYADNGKYQGKDEFAGTNLHSKTHELKKADNGVCQSCHNKFFVGADFTGQFPIDAHKDFRTPLGINGNFPSKFHGDFYHQLSPDIHANLGFSCISCHTSHKQNSSDKFDEFFAKKQSDFELKSCESCHEIKPNFAHANYHDKLSCVACHASWQGSFYELNLIKDESKDEKKWQNLIEFDKNTKKYHAVFSLSRFENLLLLNDLNSGKIAISRPIFQYNLIHFSKDGKQISPLKNKKFEIFAPFSPHTIGKKAKNCELCHENPLQLGKNYGGISEFFTPSKESKFLNSTPLSEEQLNRLNSLFYKKTRAKMIIR
ncbi:MULTISPECIES: multiheme c-type cytochrome [unclassified Campylobacter]|uniref:multiheme c-type cytochrome n=1 Tax=unclassified Campylobacter TaxID=2593542 RepID=UPI0022E9CFBC|nr:MULTISPECIES: multiheme c-type cytochrome [unclassified Campylobacter]MDA3055618.1 multiheme c-type cytochrome [Campylobacter sp. CN_NA1]MDA3064692.1 multiheme c-type cytochrome [Campylobacter sp. CN_NE4]MDA3068484.1 multiheme c-type cytochrome [Campylobacter sp. CN_NE3]MDA3082203.1 multiheme c-type cytochrome [Campylobacter sp. CN_EL2]MDA3083838.1 multiheme c-type cytochrome [Campylobacter sp. CN_NE1]